MKRGISFSAIVAILALTIVVVPVTASAHCIGDQGLAPKALTHPGAQVDGNEDGQPEVRGTEGDHDGVMFSSAAFTSDLNWCHLFHLQELGFCYASECPNVLYHIDDWCCKEWYAGNNNAINGQLGVGQDVTWTGLNPYRGNCYFINAYFAMTTNHTAIPYKHRAVSNGVLSSWTCGP